MPIDILFDFVAVHIIAGKAADADLRIDFSFTDHNHTWTMWIQRGVLNARPGAHPGTQPTVAGPRTGPGRSATPARSRPETRRGRGDHSRRRPSSTPGLAGLMDEFDPNFNIVTP
jgi:alkyl sulfatase BDS1-like metallo-beta-lactamase superfamily hydrolase